MSNTPLALYQQAIAQQGFIPDPAQRAAVEALQACFDALHLSLIHI